MVLYHVVKPKSDVASITAKRDEHTLVMGNTLFGLACHVFGCISLFVGWHFIDKLARCRAILVYPIDVG